MKHPTWNPVAIRASMTDEELFNLRVDIGRQRRYLEKLWELVSKPLKFPDRRRREDRELPKAA